MGFFSSFNSLDPSNPASALITSPFYQMYKTTFDYIYTRRDQEAYKINWLLESLRAGNTLEANGMYVVDSINENLPYYCETEDEFNLFCKRGELYGTWSPGRIMLYRGEVFVILLLAERYVKATYSSAIKINQSISKANYWRSYVVRAAYNGDLNAQALLCSHHVSRIFPDDNNLHETYKERYEDRLYQLANEGNGTAKVAIARFIKKWLSKESFILLEEGANITNLTDAWWELAKRTDMLIYYDENGERKVPLPEKEKTELKRKTVGYYLRGADANNGAWAHECQIWISQLYKDGDYYLPRDLEKSNYYLALANSNK